MARRTRKQRETKFVMHLKIALVVVQNVVSLLVLVKAI